MITYCVSEMTLLRAFLRQIWDIVLGIFWIFVMRRFPVGCYRMLLCEISDIIMRFLTPANIRAHAN